jgi:hypothetical protein
MHCHQVAYHLPSCPDGYGKDVRVTLTEEKKS